LKKTLDKRYNLMIDKKILFEAQIPRTGLHEPSRVIHHPGGLSSRGKSFSGILYETEEKYSDVIKCPTCSLEAKKIFERPVLPANPGKEKMYHVWEEGGTIKKEEIELSVLSAFEPIKSSGAPVYKCKKGHYTYC